MHDPWLRGEEGAWVLSPNTQGVHNLSVHDIMVPNTKLWDKPKLENLFPLHIVNRILEIPLFDMLEDDKITWSDNTNGEYSVKSGYNVMLQITGLQGAVNAENRWNNLWLISAPSKTKHLLWRICKACLPTRMRLQEKHVPCPLTCLVCDTSSEDDWHFLIDCESSTQAFHTAGLSAMVQYHAQQSHSVPEVVHRICSHEDVEVAGRFAMVAWLLWQNRNNKTWNNECTPGSGIDFQAQTMWDEWYQVQQALIRRHLVTSQQHNLEWNKPPQGWFKCNLDAGFHKDRNMTSTGWVLRDDRGQFVLAGSAWKHGYYSVMKGESLALIEALQALEHHGIANIIFETDSKSVVDSINYFRGGSSTFSNLIGHVISIISCKPNFMVKFVKRQANMAAHSIARAAIS